MSTIFKGYCYGREVAIKLFDMPNATHQQVIKYKEEMAILKKINHCNVARIMGITIESPSLVIITK